MGLERDGDAPEVAPLQVVEAEGVDLRPLDEVGDDLRVARVDGVGVERLVGPEQRVEELVGGGVRVVDDVGERGDDPLDGRLRQAGAGGGVLHERAVLHRSASFVDGAGGRTGPLRSASAPRKATIEAISSSVSSLPSWCQAIFRTASSRRSTEPSWK